ncbi:hypothetical protein ABB37_01481 [Leptomonas pyrrhocoris]|uniref:C3H1-type domain-containing protein n=1 Tax=Leptomonas pyrrhocoris TaxID=157538 RepID=A0A0N1J5B8_LEPPY|nr:hypothetical protein ABB37_01481 [Leptomonas pyrrhocoris]KPA85064.1 hypothetical protein ABB37_01481 [Leptomonas pyrrhocoris]|eukprot:XP_015663503.1 hypothetical protein ABB37_01481 [Leptomonas pyrrhocoris]
MHRNRNRRRRAPEGRPVQNILSTDGIPTGTFAVIDPFSKRLFIPTEAMLDTRAMHRKGVPSLCRVFLEGRCRQGSNCFQAHANVDVVTALRAAALEEPTCCALHGARSDASGLDLSLALLTQNDSGDTVLRARLEETVVTNGLRALIAAQANAVGMVAPTEVVVPTSSLCRLHSGLAGAPCCRFEQECNFVHLCRQLVRRTEPQGGLAAEDPPYVVPMISVIGSDPAPDEVMTMLDTATNHLLTSSAQGRGPPASSFNVPMSVSANLGVTPPIRFDPLALAATAPSPTPDSGVQMMGRSPIMARSFSSTTSGLVWRHNPYNSSHASSVIET